MHYANFRILSLNATFITHVLNYQKSLSETVLVFNRAVFCHSLSHRCWWHNKTELSLHSQILPRQSLYGISPAWQLWIKINLTQPVESLRGSNMSFLLVFLFYGYLGQVLLSKMCPWKPPTIHAFTSPAHWLLGNLCCDVSRMWFH